MGAALNFLVPVLWITWGVIWLVASFGTKRTVRQESTFSRILNSLPFTLAAVLLVLRRNDDLPFGPRIPHPPVVDLAALILVAGGLAFAVWARWTIGRNWSGTITLKEDHTLVRSGVYGIVRHPIYTGLLAAFAGTAIAQGDVAAALGFILALIVVLRRVRIEERWMSDAFGADYAGYRQEVPALVPFAPAGR